MASSSDPRELTPAAYGLVRQVWAVMQPRTLWAWDLFDPMEKETFLTAARFSSSAPITFSVANTVKAVKSVREAGERPTEDRLSPPALDAELERLARDLMGAAALALLVDLHVSEEPNSERVIKLDAAVAALREHLDVRVRKCVTTACDRPYRGPRELTPEEQTEMEDEAARAMTRRPVTEMGAPFFVEGFDEGAAWGESRARASSPAPDARAIEAADAALSFLSGVEELLHQEGADDGLGGVLTQLEAVASSPVPEDDRIEKAVGLLNAARIGAECTGQHGSVQLFGELIEVLTAAPVSVGDDRREGQR